MSSTSPVDSLCKAENKESSSILRLYKLNLRMKLIGLGTKIPKLAQKYIAKHLGCSDSTIERSRNDINMNSPQI